MTSRRLGEDLLTYHAGSGDTHLLTPFSDAILDALSVGGDGESRSLAEILAHHRVTAFTATEREVSDALWMLEEADIVRAVADA